MKNTKTNVAAAAPCERTFISNFFSKFQDHFTQHILQLVFLSPKFSSLTLLGIHFPITLSKIPHSLSTAIKSSLRLCAVALHCGQFHTKIILAPPVPVLDLLLVLWTAVQWGIQDFPEVGAPTPKVDVKSYYFWIFPQKTT